MPAILASIVPVACGDKPAAKPAEGRPEAKASEPTKAQPTAEDAKAFVVGVNDKLRELWTTASKAEWAKATDITDEHEAAAAAAQTKVMAYETKAIAEATRFDDVEVAPDVRRQLELLKLTSTLPAPNDAAKRQELATIATNLDAMYGKAQWCEDPANPSAETCQDLLELSAVLAQRSASAKAKDAQSQLQAWERWHTTSVPMRDKYQRLVELGNEGAKAIGFDDMGQVWRSRYDMSAEAFEEEMERLWGQVKPLYEALHCHVRAKLHERYGEAVAEDGLIPAHLTGNMWAQDWSNLYDWLEPYPAEPSINITAALQKAGYDEIKMVKTGESFFTSLGLNPLPETFWERSLFKQPPDRKVVCHASAWDVGMNNDLRLKMCIKVDHEDFVTVHHELGHHYYYNNYYTMPALFQSGAHDGFHEAIGDAIALSITPAYLKEIGLLKKISNNDKGVVNSQMQDALQKIAFLPFGKLIDQWRWDVFSGQTKPETYNADWWALRAQYQGVGAPSKRGEEFFDPGAKYHIPGNTPYARYFLAHILQFQFHRAMCKISGHTGPLHECSVYGSKEAGQKLQAMLAMGASKPWPDALAELTGTREMDGSALIEYFGPLMAYLEEQNQGRTCGWSADQG